MKKRILSMLLAIVMVVGLVPGFTLTASAAEIEVYATGTLVSSTAWTIYNNGLLVIDGKGNSVATKWDSTTASPWNNYKAVITRVSFTNCENWVRIPECTFRGLSNLKEVTLPENIEEICEYAFTGTAIETIILPEGLKTIGRFSFGMCESLNYININDGVTTIGSDAFYDCSTLKAVSIPDSVTSIGQNLFKNCTNLEYVRLSENVEKVAGSMFFGCAMLKNVSLPASVTVIGSKAFSNASNLEGVYYHGTTEPTTYNPGLNGATFSLAPDTMVIYAPDDYNGTTMGLKASWENDVHNVTKIDGHFVNIAYTANGAVKVGASIVPAGNTVTVDIMAYKNYELETIIVTDTNGQTVELSGSGHSRTFTMPEGDVTINATFKSTVTPHVHSWTYTANGATITATCDYADTCHNPLSKVEISKGNTSSLAFRPGHVKSMTVSGKLEDIEIPDLVYTLKSTGEPATPINPGVYVASLTIKNVTATYEFEITRDNLNFTFFDYYAPQNLTYDGTPKYASVVLHEEYEPYVGEYTVYYNTGTTEPINAGTYTVKVDVEESDYYSEKIGLTMGRQGRFTIASKSIDDLTYEGLVAGYPVGATPDVAITYGDMTLVKDTDYTVEYADNTEPGTATMTITGKGNYTGSKTLDYTIIDHTHKWTYTKENETTIKATCTAEGCPDTNGGTVTITAPALTVFGGTGSANATLSAETLGDYTNLSASIKYWEGDTELTSAPTDAGTYKASITVENVTAFVEYAINKAQATPPTGLTAVYGQTLADVELPTGWTWADSTDSVGEVGVENKHFANFAGDANHAAASNVEVTVTVSKSGATMTATANNECTYGEPVIITVRGISPTGEAPAVNTFSLTAPTENQVAIWNGETQLTEPQTVTGSDLTFTVTGLDAGQYTLTARFTGNDNMAATSAEVKFTVNKAAQGAFSITGQPTDEIAYGDSFTLGTSGGTGAGTVTWSATGTASVDASGKVTINGVGDFTVTATKAGGTNYTDATDTYSGTSVKATPNIGDVTYNGGALYDSTNISTVELTRSNTTIPGTLELTDSKLTAGTKAYNWKFTPEDSTNYNTITGTVTLTVTADVLEKIEASGTLTKTAYVYGDTFSIEGLTVTATYASGATENVTAYVAFDALAVGQESIILNYQGKTCTVSGITVSRKQLDVSGMSWTVPTGENAVYSGNVKTATLNGTLPDGVTVTKVGDTATNVGSYTATAIFSLADGYSAENYEIIGTNPLTASWEITVKTVAETDIGISGVDASYTYTGSAIEPVVAVMVGGKTLVKDTDYTVFYGANTNASTDGGSVTVTLKGNYIGTKTVPFTILAKEQTAFSISGVSSATYGDPAITLIANGGSGDGAITWSIASGSEFAEISGNGATATLTIKGAGSVVVNAVKAASTDGNYGATGVAVHSIVINKATVTANNFTYTDPTDLVYSKSAKKAGVTGNAAYGAITITYYSDSSLTNVVDPINVGTYYVGITTAGGVNYNRLTKTLIGSFTISAKEIDVTAKAQTRQYNQDNPTLTYEADALYDGDSFTGALATDATKTSDVGEYMITEGTLSAGDNYKIKFTGAKLVITKADGPAALTVTGSYTNDGMTYTYTVDAIEGAEYSKNGTEWQDSNVFSGLSAGHKYTFYARIKETKNVLAGGIGQSAEVDLSKLPGNGTVTIAGWTYGESANAPVVNSTTGNNEVTYLYESTDGKGHSSEAAPTNAGAYKLTVTFATTDTHNGTTASAEFTIAKATPDVTAPTGLNATYGDTLADVELDTGWTWKDAGSTEVGNAGENTFTVIYTKDNSGNYNTVEKTVTITVSPKTVTAAVSVVGDSFIFGGSEQKPGVTVKDGETTIPESEYTVTYKDNTNAGTAAVTVTDKDGGNYTVSGTTTFEISKKASSALSGVEREFMRTIATTGNEIDVAAMLPDNRGTTTYTITSSGYTVLENVSVDENGKLVFDTKTSAAAASDTITVKVVMQNYTDVTLTVSVILNEKTPQNITGVTGAEGLIYNGNTQQGYTGTPASEKYTGSYEITYTGRDNSYNSSVAPTDAGEYTVTFKIPDTDLYYSGNVSVNFTIGKAQATVTADDKEAYVGKRMPELTYKVSGLIGSDTINVELSCDANMNRAGETPIVVTAKDPNGNYEITTVNGTLTVKMIYLPIIPSNPTYPPVVDGDDNGDVTVTPKNPEKGDTVTITPDPDAGYEVDEIVVSDKNGNLVEVINNRDGTYSFKQPNGKVNIEVTFKEIIKVCPGDKTCPMYGYTDLDMNVWYHDGVHFCIENKLMNGTSTTTFAPGATTSRAMIVTILWRLAGEPIVNYAMSFDDVASDTWYKEAIRWAASEGIVNGYSDTAFGPNDNITREQLATILYRYEQKNGGGFKGMWMFRMDYVDLAEVSDWAYEAMCWMNMNSIVNGKPGKVLDPKGNATRAEAATMLYRYCDIIGKDEKN